MISAELLIMAPMRVAFTSRIRPRWTPKKPTSRSGALPNVALSRPPVRAPARSASCSVAEPINPASGMTAATERKNWRGGGQLSQPLINVDGTKTRRTAKTRFSPETLIAPSQTSIGLRSVVQHCCSADLPTLQCEPVSGREARAVVEHDGLLRRHMGYQPIHRGRGRSGGDVYEPAVEARVLRRGLRLGEDLLGDSVVAVRVDDLEHGGIPACGRVLVRDVEEGDRPGSGIGRGELGHLNGLLDVVWKESKDSGCRQAATSRHEDDRLLVVVHQRKNERGTATTGAAVGNERDTKSEQRETSAEQGRLRLGEEVGNPRGGNEHRRDHAQDEPGPPHVDGLRADALDVALVKAHEVERDAGYGKCSQQSERIEVTQQPDTAPRENNDSDRNGGRD